MVRRFQEATSRYADMVIAAFAFAAGALALNYVPAWRAFERRIFDELTVHTAPAALKQPISLIGISDEAIREMKLEWPWPRRLHAELVDRVAQGGAVVIALDLVFDTPAKNPEDDRLFAQAIAKAGNVVLAADFREHDDALYKMWKLVEPIAPLVDAGAIAGRATIPFDLDGVVRQIPNDADAFWRQIIKVLQVKAPSVDVPPLPGPDSMIRYMDPDVVFDPIPFHLVLQASPEELKTAFEGRIVIVGRELRASPELGLASSDLFSTSFRTKTNFLTAGMKLHATIVDNALSGMAIRPLGRMGNTLIAAFAALLSYFTMRRWRPFVSTAALSGVALVLGAASGYLFVQERLWVATATPVAVALLAFLLYGGRAYAIEQRRKRQVQTAFSRYLSPDLVQQIVEDPKKLELGGESREITVLFTDLAGFTKLTEKHPPPVVQQILFKHFTAMTEVIHAHKGTVVQFIGDAVMAFWGAPLDDQDHALHAVQSAIGMQRAMEQLREELRAQGLPEIRMRIGVNTCTAIVGNMGSSTRLAYTAMGDGINAGSRLEGANKFWGTPILVSGETVAKLGGRTPMRRVDRIRVSGKSQAMDVYTPSEDLSLNARTDAAFDAYLRRDWDTADRIYAELLTANPADGVALRLRERIDEWRRDPANATPEEGAALEKL
jgi:adenylate cyclase